MQFRQSVKSRLSALALSIWRSRERYKLKGRQLRQRVEELQQQVLDGLAQNRRDASAFRAVIGELNERIRVLEHDLRVIQEQPFVLPSDPPLPRHRYGLMIISLALMLAPKIGLRASEQAMLIFFKWLNVETKVPDWTTIRNWMQRLGVASLLAPIEKATDWNWIADHSIQLGKEKVLAILGVRTSKLPKVGTALRHNDVRLLHLEVGTSWKTADVAASYRCLRAIAGTPERVLTDSDSALRGAVESLKAPDSNAQAAADFKHKAANVLESVVGGDERFAAFQKETTATRCAIQQTELAHLVPPNKKPKARYMNLASLLKWGMFALWVVDDLTAQARQGIDDQRIEDKLGWIKEYRTEVASWNACQKVVSLGATLINEQYLTHDTVAKFTSLVADYQIDDASREVTRRLTDFLQEQTLLLKAGERLPLSTEILESTFGLYKQLEGQHSKGGFTSLLAAFGALLVDPSPEVIREAFTRVTVKATRDWITAELGQTVPAKRQAAFREFKAKRPGATNSTSTT